MFDIELKKKKKKLQKQINKKNWEKETYDALMTILLAAFFNVGTFSSRDGSTKFNSGIINWLSQRFNVVKFNLTILDGSTVSWLFEALKHLRQRRINTYNSWWNEYIVQKKEEEKKQR